MMLNSTKFFMTFPEFSIPEMKLDESLPPAFVGTSVILFDIYIDNEVYLSLLWSSVCHCSEWLFTCIWDGGDWGFIRQHSENSKNKRK